MGLEHIQVYIHDAKFLMHDPIGVMNAHCDVSVSATFVKLSNKGYEGQKVDGRRRRGPSISFLSTSTTLSESNSRRSLQCSTSAFPRWDSC